MSKTISTILILAALLSLAPQLNDVQAIAARANPGPAASDVIRSAFHPSGAPLENWRAASNAVQATVLEPRSCYVRLNDSAADYSTVQAAVDASTQPTDVVKVAGYCGGVNAYGGLGQQVYLTKTLTIQGGYTITNWTTPDPVAHPTTLDALGQGRVFYIAGSISPTLAGLRLTGGDAAGLGGVWGIDSGGGIYIVEAQATLSDNEISGNTAHLGGGVCLENSSAHLEHNRITGNTTDANGLGGGLYLAWGQAILAGNMITGNIASANGGGAYLYEAPATLTSNVIATNTAHFQAGGLYLEGSNATLDANRIISNTATDHGGGLYLWGGAARLSNNVIADNRAGFWGGAMFFESAFTRLAHNTIARNTSSDGSGVVVYDSWGNPSHVVLTNTLLAGHSVGLYVAAPSTATLEATLWDNVTDWSGNGAILTGTVNVWGNPAFAADGYHITASSKAKDAGVAASVLADIDGDPRPIGAGYDLGADEYYVPNCFARLNNGPIYSTVQAAVDASSNPADIVKVAGYCTGVNSYGGLSQQVYLTKTLTIQGGYTTTNWTTPDPLAHPTTLDALGQGRVLHITGNISPTITGLRITGGDASGLGGGVSGFDGGGGINVQTATATISNCIIYSNIASSRLADESHGGGVFLGNSAAVLQNNTIMSNTASPVEGGFGGGLYIYEGAPVLVGNTVQGNSASAASGGYGGGLYLWNSAAVLEGNTVRNNIAGVHQQSAGGGLYAGRGSATLTNNCFENNTASIAATGRGGGVALGLALEKSITLQGNTIVSNIASLAGEGGGGGVYVEWSSAALRDNIITGNSASAVSYGRGGGLYLWNSAAVLEGNTVQDNIAGVKQSEGGGLYVGNSDAILRNNAVEGNTASVAASGWGGGLALFGSVGSVTLQGNTITHNTASLAGDGSGGGMYVERVSATLQDNVITGNTASRDSVGACGGLYLSHSNFVLQGNLVQDNTAAHWEGYGGGLCVDEGSATLTNNIIAGNVAATADMGYGGGLALSSAAATLEGNTIISNTAALSATVDGESKGGGLWVMISQVTLTNNLIVGNHAHTAGSGLWLSGSDPTRPTAGRLLHTTIADNHGSGEGVYAGFYTTLALTNTILSGHASVGITATAGSTITLQATLWHGNGMNWGGTGSIFTGTVNVYGAPAFANPTGGDYHLTAASAAIDAGVPAGVAYDIDSQTRPQGSSYDIGADEYLIVLPPALLSPANGALLNDNTPTLVWQASADATGYRVNLNGVVSNVGNVTEYTTTVLADGLYTWTVVAYSAYYTSPHTSAWRFTIDATSPAISIVNPMQGAVDVAIDAPVIITFSEAIQAGTFTCTVEPDPAGWAAVWSGDGAVATLGHAPFAYSTTYTITITAANDPAGNSLANAPYSWSFTTAGAPDTAPPAITAVSPLNGAANVTLTAQLIITFSEPIDAGTFACTLAPNPGGLSVAWSGGGNVATLSHAPFAYSTTYTVTITAANDPAGNSLANAPYDWSFTTAGAPDTKRRIYLPAVFKSF